MDQGDPPRHGEGDHPKDGGGAPSVITGPRDTLKRARKLRSEMSLPERMLWRLLRGRPDGFKFRRQHPARSEEHTSELQSLMRISHAVFCLKKKNSNTSPTQ